MSMRVWLNVALLSLAIHIANVLFGFTSPLAGAGWIVATLLLAAYFRNKVLEEEKEEEALRKQTLREE